MAIATVGIVGAGTMGAGIAQVALEAGHEVFLHDTNAQVADRAQERIRDGLARRARRVGVDPAGVDQVVEAQMARLHVAPSIDDLGARSDLVIEAAIEDLAVKRALFRALDGAASPEAILATNTSALSIAAVASETSRPGRVLGLHFFNPAPVMALVEVVAAAATDRRVVETATALMRAWGKTLVHAADSPGFIVNRVNRAFTLEPLAMLEGHLATVARVDRLVREAGFPMGPFELMDLVGLDVNLSAARGIYAAVRGADGDGGPADRFRPSPIQARMVAAGELGRKTGAGFYRYDAEGRSVGPAPAFDVAEDPRRAIDDAGIVDRVVLAIVNEAYRALEEQVASKPDIDLALRLGAGHPVGPFERVAGLGGAAGVVAALGRLSAAGPRFDPAAALLAEAAEP